MRGFDCDNWPPVMYRVFDADGALLYVGATSNIKVRLSSHRRSFWFPLAARARFQIFPTMWQARLAETLAITNERPRFNIHQRMHSTDPANVCDKILALESLPNAHTSYTQKRLANLRALLRPDEFGEAS